MLDIVISVKNWIEKIQRPAIYLHINNDSTNLPLKLLVHSKWREEREREGDINPVESLFVEWHDGDWCFYVFFGVFFLNANCVFFLSIKLCSFASVKWAQTNIACGILCDWLDPMKKKMLQNYCLFKSYTNMVCNVDAQVHWRPRKRKSIQINLMSISIKRVQCLQWIIYALQWIKKRRSKQTKMKATVPSKDETDVSGAINFNFSIIHKLFIYLLLCSVCVCVCWIHFHHFACRYFCVSSLHTLTWRCLLMFYLPRSLPLRPIGL